MDTIKTIKGVNEEAWQEFKSIASRNNVKMGRLFESMVGEYKKKTDIIWRKILNPGKILSDEEAEDMLKVVKKLREERGFRD